MDSTPPASQAKAIWNSWQVSFALWLASASSCLWFWFHPSTGAAIAVLGAVAAIMSIREIGPREKFFWMVVIFGLLSVELRSIKNDDAERAAEREKETKAFTDIGTGIQTSITNSEQQFQETVSRVERVSGLAEKSIATVTGGDSFCLMNFWDTNTLLTLSSGEPFFQAEGAYPLYEVVASIVDQNAIGKLSVPEQLKAPRQTIGLGNIGKGQIESVGILLPFTDAPKKQSFLIQFSARNGNWWEVIRLYRSKDMWLKAFKVMKENKDGTILYECVPKAFPVSELDWIPTKNNSCANR
jgi:hypothetical protein